MLRGQARPTSLVRALCDYIKMRHRVQRYLDYPAENMQRFYFLSRQPAEHIDQIGQLGFLSYTLRGLQRFVR